jgi:GNAT superfamily N-acetyltransferase
VGDLVAAAVDTLLGYLRLGNECVTTDLATFVRNPAVPMVHDANHGAAITAEGAEEVEQVLASADDVLASSVDRSFKITPGVPPAFEARLVLEGYRASAAVQMVLEGEVRAIPPDIDVRTVSGDVDWQVLLSLNREADEEETSRPDQGGRSAELGEQMFLSMRAKAPEVSFFLARVDGQDCGFFSSWPGENGVGVVEDLFVLPGYRRRGIATALIAHAVADARARGAGEVLIGADASDTPKQMYADLGFRPLLMMRGYWKPR